MESMIGKTIDNYRILEVIGRGGMGVVFKAVDTNLEMFVALKMIDPVLARDESFVRRFKTEAKALAKLENPYIVSVHALREIESGFFMVMEYVQAKPLSKFLRDFGPFTLKDTVSISKQLLEAIGHAHKVGIIHRDIKPSNILLDDNGKVKITDFGLAKVIQQKGPGSTVTQAKAGTLYYMSPEQVKGLKNVDIRSDLYSLGMTLYEMVAGRVPFEKTDSDFTIQKKIVEGEIPSPVKFNANIPKKFTKIISKAIEKNPDKRYQTAEEMLYEIKKYEEEIFDEKTVVQYLNKNEIRLKNDFKFDYKNDKKRKSGLFQKPFLIIAVSVCIVVIASLYFLLFTVHPYVSIETSPPNALININDRDVGQSPTKYKIDNEAKIHIKATKDGFIPIDTSLNLMAGKSAKLFLNLIPLPKEKIDITTKPANAKIFINNNLAGNSPLVKYLLSPGKYQIKIERLGFLDIDTNINVNKNLANIFNFNLNKDPNYKGFGFLTINSNPIGASVILNGKLVGETKYQNNHLPVGEYQLIIRKNGYGDYNEHFKISLNKSKSISKQLSVLNTSSVNQSGNIKVTTKPAGANVYLNNKLVGSTPYINDKISVGTYRVLIKKDGYLESNKLVKIESNKSNSISVDLQPIHKLVINSEPDGAEVLINNKIAGKTPYTSSNTTLGEYLVTLKKPGYKSYEEKIKILENSTDTEIHPKLERIVSKVEVLVRPFGSIYVDGLLKIQDTNSPFNIQLTYGKHNIKIVHPSLGSFIKEINITEEKQQKFIFDLRRILKLTIISIPPNSEIYINGESSGHYTPSLFHLKPGNYKIQVKKEGYEALEKAYAVDSDIYEAPKDREERLEFSLKKVQ